MIVGDQLTCKVIRGCKLWRMSEPEVKDRLVWANETPGGYIVQNNGMHVAYMYMHVCTYILIGDFHFMWECLKVLLLIFWGTPSLPGSLCNMREIICRNLVDKEASFQYS